jgi:predicted nuclease with RNAse H fold
MSDQTTFVGIDFGARQAGTTAICAVGEDSLLHFRQSAKNQDADAWLLQVLEQQQPSAVYIDAPLSLPAVYRGAGEDYFYRSCDRQVHAMSPMFLGGLTARAMRLRAFFMEIPFYEIYPGHYVRAYMPEAVNYKKSDLPAFCGLLAGQLPLAWEQAPQSWHQADACLAWFSGWRHCQGLAAHFGDEAEGLIFV